MHLKGQPLATNNIPKPNQDQGNDLENHERKTNITDTYQSSGLKNM